MRVVRKFVILSQSFDLFTELSGGKSVVDDFISHFNPMAVCWISVPYLGGEYFKGFHW